MERIQAAIQKAKEQRAGGAPAGAVPPPRPAPRRAPSTPVWDSLAAFSPNPDQLRRERIVTFDRDNPAHMTFDMIRTKILRQMAEKGWTSLAITSPTSGCGKTMVSLNLAFSLAQQKDSRTVLVDLDLRRPSVARSLGMPEAHSMENLLQGTEGAVENFVRYGDRLAIGAGTKSVRNPAELLNHASCSAALARLKTDLRPDTILYDLPPMLTCDDVMAFLPNVDCVLLVAGAEVSTLDEIDKCEHDLSEQTNVMGVILNKCRYASEQYGYYP